MMSGSILNISLFLDSMDKYLFSQSKETHKKTVKESERNILSQIESICCSCCFDCSFDELNNDNLLNPFYFFNNSYANQLESNLPYSASLISLPLSEHELNLIETQLNLIAKDHRESCDGQYKNIHTLFFNKKAPILNQTDIYSCPNIPFVVPYNQPSHLYAVQVIMGQNIEEEETLFMDRCVNTDYVKYRRKKGKVQSVSSDGRFPYEPSINSLPTQMQAMSFSIPDQKRKTSQIFTLSMDPRLGTLSPMQPTPNKVWPPHKEMKTIVKRKSTVDSKESLIVGKDSELQLRANKYENTYSDIRFPYQTSIESLPKNKFDDSLYKNPYRQLVHVYHGRVVEKNPFEQAKTESKLCACQTDESFLLEQLDKLLLTQIQQMIMDDYREMTTRRSSRSRGDQKSVVTSQTPIISRCKFIAQNPAFSKKVSIRIQTDPSAKIVVTDNLPCPKKLEAFYTDESANIPAHPQSIPVYSLEAYEWEPDLCGLENCPYEDQKHYRRARPIYQEPYREFCRYPCRDNCPHAIDTRSSLETPILSAESAFSKRSDLKFDKHLLAVPKGRRTSTNEPICADEGACRGSKAKSAAPRSDERGKSYNIEQNIDYINKYLNSTDPKKENVVSTSRRNTGNKIAEKNIYPKSVRSLPSEEFPAQRSQSPKPCPKLQDRPHTASERTTRSRRENENEEEIRSLVGTNIIEKRVIKRNSDNTPLTCYRTKETRSSIEVSVRSITKEDDEEEEMGILARSNITEKLCIKINSDDIPSRMRERSASIEMSVRSKRENEEEEEMRFSIKTCTTKKPSIQEPKPISRKHEKQKLFHQRPVELERDLKKLDRKERQASIEEPPLKKKREEDEEQEILSLSTKSFTENPPSKNLELVPIKQEQPAPSEEPPAKRKREVDEEEEIKSLVRTSVTEIPSAKKVEPLPTTSDKSQAPKHRSGYTPGDEEVQMTYTIRRSITEKNGITKPLSDVKELKSVEKSNIKIKTEKDDTDSSKEKALLPSTQTEQTLIQKKVSEKSSKKRHESIIKHEPVKPIYIPSQIPSENSDLLFSQILDVKDSDQLKPSRKDIGTSSKIKSWNSDSSGYCKCDNTKYAAKYDRGAQTDDLFHFEPKETKYSSMKTQTIPVKIIDKTGEGQLEKDSEIISQAPRTPAEEDSEHIITKKDLDKESLSYISKPDLEPCVKSDCDILIETEQIVIDLKSLSEDHLLDSKYSNAESTNERATPIVKKEIADEKPRGLKDRDREDFEPVRECSDPSRDCDNSRPIKTEEFEPPTVHMNRENDPGTEYSSRTDSRQDLINFRRRKPKKFDPVTDSLDDPQYQNKSLPNKFEELEPGIEYSSQSNPRQNLIDYRRTKPKEFDLLTDRPESEEPEQPGTDYSRRLGPRQDLIDFRPAETEKFDAATDRPNHQYKSEPQYAGPTRDREESPRMMEIEGPVKEDWDRRKGRHKSQPQETEYSGSSKNRDKSRPKEIQGVEKVKMKEKREHGQPVKSDITRENEVKFKNASPNVSDFDKRLHSSSIANLVPMGSLLLNKIKDMIASHFETWKSTEAGPLNIVVEEDTEADAEVYHKAIQADVGEVDVAITAKTKMHKQVAVNVNTTFTPNDKLKNKNVEGNKVAETKRYEVKLKTSQDSRDDGIQQKHTLERSGESNIKRSFIPVQEIRKKESLTEVPEKVKKRSRGGSPARDAFVLAVTPAETPKQEKIAVDAKNQVTENYVAPRKRPLSLKEKLNENVDFDDDDRKRLHKIHSKLKTALKTVSDVLEEVEIVDWSPKEVKKHDE